MVPPSPRSLTVLGHGPGYLIVNKPSGVSTHNEAAGEPDALNLALDLLTNDRNLAHACGWTSEFGPAPVHRLDKETSGVLLLATQRSLASQLQQAFESREACKKIYRAILRGTPKTVQGVWNQPLSERAEGRRQPAGPAEDRKPCETRYEVLRANKFFADVRIELLTGRQHQIRRHAVLNGHVVINDTRYGEPKHVTITEKHYGVSRMMLHAESLEIQTSQGLRLKAEAPLPQEFERLFPKEGGGSR